MNILSSLLEFIGNKIKSTSTLTGLTPSSKVSNAEYRFSQVGNIVTGHYVFRVNEALELNNEVLLSGLPRAATRFQVVGMCVAGTHNTKSTRFAIFNDKIITFYSAPVIVQGDTWFVSFTYATT